MKFAILETSGTQYAVNEGDTITVDIRDDKKDSTIVFKSILLVQDEKEIFIGKPYVSNYTVTAQVAEHVKGEKLRVSRYRAKSRYRRTIGYRSQLSKLNIVSIDHVNNKNIKND